MVADGRDPILSAAVGRAAACAGALALAWALSSCGLVLRGLEQVLPDRETRDVICDRELLQVGLAAGPYPPFVFPVADTPDGPRVTGLDIELVREIEQELARRCGKRIKPVLRLVPFIDLFTLIHEGTIDLFITATPADVAGTGRGGFAYSLPYFTGGGIMPVARNRQIAGEIRRRLEDDTTSRDDPLARLQALSGFRTAVVDGSSAAAYAHAHMAADSFIVCNSLTAAFEAEQTVGAQPDLVLGSQPVLEFTVSRMRPAWEEVTMPNGQPLLLTHEYLSILLADEKLSLRWFINNLLFRLKESGMLERIRRRWLEDEYDYRRRAETEGLPVEEGARDVQQRRDCYEGMPGFGKLRTLERE